MTLLSLPPSSLRFDAPRGTPNVQAPVSDFAMSWNFPSLGGHAEGVIDISAAATQHDLATMEQAFCLALCGQASLRD
jgi:hypothetical protein